MSDLSSILSPVEVERRYISKPQSFKDNRILSKYSLKWTQEYSHLPLGKHLSGSLWGALLGAHLKGPCRSTVLHSESTLTESDFCTSEQRKGRAIHQHPLAALVPHTSKKCDFLGMRLTRQRLLGIRGNKKVSLLLGPWKCSAKP